MFKPINLTAIYVLWLREMKRFVRAKSRVIGTLAMPLFFLAFLGLGFTNMNIPGYVKGYRLYTFFGSWDYWNDYAFHINVCRDVCSVG